MPDALVVDADRNFLNALAELTENQGFTTSTATTLRDARERLLHKQPDIALIELRFPDGSGLEILRELEKTPTHVVVITGHADVDSAIEALRLGATDYLTKPLDLGRIKEILADLRRAAAEGEEPQRAAEKYLQVRTTPKRTARRSQSKVDPAHSGATSDANGSAIDSKADREAGGPAASVDASGAASPASSFSAAEPPAKTTPQIGRFLPLGSTVTASDHLNRGGLVEALAAMLEDPQQETPLTIALLGDWGAGKSTLMALLRERLLKGRPRRFCFADFNAWEYELTENMAAGLAQEVVAGLVHDARLEVPRARRLAAPAADARPIPSRRFHLSRWVSPGFWWLFGGYLLRRHGMRLLGIALLVAGLGWAVQAGLLTPEVIAPKDEDLQQALGLAGALGGLVLLFYLLRGVKHILEHPFAIGIKTYLRLPRYEQHLGLVPVIKREVETLARLWLGRTWTQRRVAEWLAKRDRRRSFPRLDRWCRPRRLVVFVDDLDRCSHARIGQTLDAIRLVMDVPQVVVVLGIDPRIAFQAMALQYKEIADPRRSPEEIAREYLGKIIQVPIRLRQPSSGELEEFVAQRLFAGSAASQAEPTAGAPTASTPAGTVAFETASPAASGSRSAAGGGVQPIRAVEAEQSAPPEGPPPIDLLAEVMRPDEGERRRFQDLVDAYRFHNPRQLIRLFNSYNLLKLFAATRRGTGGQVPPREELMRLLFDEEFLHETPAPAQADLERALRGDRLATRRLAPELADRVEAVRKLDLPSGDLGAPPAGVGRSSRLTDQTMRDFVRLVVLPASPANPPPKAKRSSAKRRRPAKKGEKASPPSAGARADRKWKAAESITEREAPVPPIWPKP